MKIIVASNNPIKHEATLIGFKRIFPDNNFEIEGVPAPSGIADQPSSDKESILGAKNRVNSVIKEYPDADYWVGLEAGIKDTDDGMETYGWVFIKSKDQEGLARSGSLFLPLKIAELIHQGKELGEADDIVFGGNNTKQQSGAVGILTHGHFERAEAFSIGVILALIPFINPELYSTT